MEGNYSITRACIHSLESCIVDVHMCSVAQSCPTLCTPWAVDLQASVSMRFPRENTGLGCHFILQAILLTQGSNLGLASPAFAGGFFTPEPSGKFYIADRKC